jgi:hypothetical protein
MVFTTEKYRLGVLVYDPIKAQINTLAHGDLTERVGRPAEHGNRVLIDPKRRMIVSLLYQGMLNVIPVNQSACLATTMSDTKKSAMDREPSNNRKRKNDYDKQAATKEEANVSQTMTRSDSQSQPLLGESCNIR